MNARASRLGGLLILASAFGLAAGCGMGSGRTGRITVLLKDAPADVTAAVVTIAEIDLVGSSGTTVLSTQKTTTDLLTLANDAATLVDGAEVPVGTYGQLRFVVTGAYLEASGVIYASSPTYEGLPPDRTVGGTLRMPSLAQSGLKVDLPGGALTVGTVARVVLVDFDVSQSFGHQAGASGAWVMHPVLTATDVELTGTLDVTLRLGAGATLPSPATLGGVTALLTPAVAGGTTTAVAMAPSADGTSATTIFKFLPPGDYRLDFAPPPPVVIATSPPVPATLTVTSGQETAASFDVVSAH